MAPNKKKPAKKKPAKTFDDIKKTANALKKATQELELHLKNLKNAMKDDPFMMFGSAPPKGGKRKK